MIENLKSDSQFEKKSPDQQFIIYYNNQNMSISILNDQYKLIKINEFNYQIDSLTKLIIVNHQLQFVGGDPYSKIQNRLLRVESSGRHPITYTMPNSVSMCSLCIQNNYNIIMTGGRVEGTLKPHNKALVFNCILGEQTELPPMKCAREAHVSIVTRNRLFVIGGQSGTKHRKSLEVLDMEAWEDYNQKRKRSNNFAIKETQFIGIDLTLYRIVDMSECVWDENSNSILIFGGNYSHGVVQRLRFQMKSENVDGRELDLDKGLDPDHAQQQQQQEDEECQQECIDEVSRDQEWLNGPVQKLGHFQNNILIANATSLQTFQQDQKQQFFSACKMMDLENCYNSHIGLF